MKKAANNSFSLFASSSTTPLTRRSSSRTIRTTTRIRRCCCSSASSSSSRNLSIKQQDLLSHNNKSFHHFHHHHLRRHNNNNNNYYFSTISRGHDITYESLTFGSGDQNTPPKVILLGYGPTGFDVSNILKKVVVEDSDNNNNNSNKNTITDQVAPQESGTIHMNGSILVFPNGCFLWNIDSPQDVTLESLSAVLLYRNPTPLEYLFIGYNVNTNNGSDGSDGGDIPTDEFNRIRTAMQTKNIVVEKLNVANAMGTFNILNAEDRQVAVALVIDKTGGGDDESDGGEE